MLDKTTRQYKRGKPRKGAIQTRRRISVLEIILALATLVGGVAAALVFLPRISVVPADPVDSSNPFSASFTITNTNFIPLRDVNVSLGVGQISTEPAQLDPNFNPSFETRFSTGPEWSNHELQMDERFTITPTDSVRIGPPARLSGADIAIVVSYKPWFLPLRREKIFRFIAKKQTNGQFYWYSLPMK